MQALVLGAIERHIGVAQDIAGVLGGAVDHGNADRSADIDAVAADDERRADRRENALRHGLQPPAASWVLPTGREPPSRKSNTIFEPELRTALQQNGRVDVRFGSKADVEVPAPDVRFTPKSGHRRREYGCPLVPKAD